MSAWVLWEREIWYLYLMFLLLIPFNKWSMGFRVFLILKMNSKTHLKIPSPSQLQLSSGRKWHQENYHLMTMSLLSWKNWTIWSLVQIKSFKSHQKTVLEIVSPFPNKRPTQLLLVSLIKLRPKIYTVIWENLIKATTH